MLITGYYLLLGLPRVLQNTAAVTRQTNKQCLITPGANAVMIRAKVQPSAIIQTFTLRIYLMKDTACLVSALKKKKKKKTSSISNQECGLGQIEAIYRSYKKREMACSQLSVVFSGQPAVLLFTAFLEVKSCQVMTDRTSARGKISRS